MAYNAAYQIEFDTPTVARIGAMVGAQSLMAGYYLQAMNACVEQVKTRAKMHAPVGVYNDGTGRTGGTLRRGIKGFTKSPWMGVVGVGKEVPYARRREFGFDNMTDRLGRYYPMDPADSAKRANMFYLKRSLNDSLPFIANAFRTASALSVRQMNLA